MTISRKPIELNRVIKDASIVDRLATAIRGLPANAPDGGLTVRAIADYDDDQRPRALIYWGPLPIHADHDLRPLVKPDYDLSHVRDTTVSHQTATADDPRGY